jgi:molybdenum cofactor cytidylyltransferase
MEEAREDYSSISAVVLAAGQSLRMGTPKMVLPWQGHSIIWQVVNTLSQAGVKDIVVVTGGAREQVESALSGTAARFSHNPDYDHTEMLHSLQIGIQALPETCQALLVVLGDQPMIEENVIRAVVSQYLATQASLVIPSYQMHRGHPWLVGEPYWRELLEMSPRQTMRDFIQAHADQITYVEVNTPSILKDMDTPEDYQNYFR